MSELIECIDGLTARDITRRIAKTANGTPFYLQTSGLGGFCTEYQRIYNDFVGSGVAPSDAIAEAQNTMVCGLIDDGVWAKLDVFYVYAAHANGGGEALMNWRATGLFNAVAVNNPVFTALEGFAGGTNEYINCNWNPSVNGVNFTLNSASIGVYSRTNVAENKSDAGAADAVSWNMLRSRTASDTFFIYSNTAALDSNGPNLDSRGMFISNRDGANSDDGYINGNKLFDGVRAATGEPNADMYVLAHNANGVADKFCTKQISCFFAGGGMTPTDITILTNAFEVYMDSNGKGVIP